VAGQVIMIGQTGNDWSGATVMLTDTAQNDITNAAGQFSIAAVIPGIYTSITADAPNYLPAVCNAPIVTAPATNLTTVSLLSGDVNDDDIVDIVDASSVGVALGETGTGLATDINRDEVVDILDIILVSVNFGEGAQTWDCVAE
jgi:hypothetical protein